MSYLTEMADGGYRLEALDVFHRIMVPHALRMAEVGPDELVVDLGAAQGHCAVSLRLAGYSRVAVVDIDPVYFESFASQYDIQGHRCDLETESLPFAEGSVGAFVNFHLIEHLAKPENLLRETHRALRPGGALVLVTPDWRKQYKTFWRDPTHVHPYDKVSIRRLLGIHGFSGIRVLSWGSAFGFGRVGAFRLVPRLGMIGADMLALAHKGVPEAPRLRQSGRA